MDRRFKKPRNPLSSSTRVSITNLNVEDDTHQNSEEHLEGNSLEASAFQPELPEQTVSHGSSALENDQTQHANSSQASVSTPQSEIYATVMMSTPPRKLRLFKHN